jgi:CRP-like cAMP-binding protein
MNTKETTRDIILDTTPISETSIEAIIDIVDYVEYQKNEVFITEGKRNSKEYFVLEGVCRSYLLNPEGEEITISFFADKSVLSPFTTRTYFGVSNMNFQALTPLKMGVMDAKSFEKLMVDNLEIREFGNVVLRNELKQKVEKEIGMASLTARERLIKFREQYPLLENIIPHTTISTYLGITNISLSRLRNELLK